MYVLRTVLKVKHIRHSPFDALFGAFTFDLRMCNNSGQGIVTDTILSVIMK